MRPPSKVELRKIVVLTFAAGILVAAGCLKNDKTGNDGAPCDSSSDCKSKQCANGACAGRACDKQDAGECDPGWVCTGGDQSDLARALGDDQGPACTPTCGVCPATMHCPAFTASGVNDGDAGVVGCTNGPARVATISGPDTVLAGSTVSYSVSFAPAQTFEVYGWYYGVGGAKPDYTTGSTGTADGTLVLQVEGSPLGESDAVIGVVASDVNTSYDPRFMSGEGSRKIHVTCTPPGGDCSAYGSCCSGGTSCDYSGATATCK